MRSAREPCLFRATFQRVVPANAGTHTARTLVLAVEQRPFFTLGPGVMGPCVRRDDPLRARARPLPHQRAAQFSHMRSPCRKRGEVNQKSAPIQLKTITRYHRDPRDLLRKSNSAQQTRAEFGSVQSSRRPSSAGVKRSGVKPCSVTRPTRSKTNRIRATAIRRHFKQLTT
jgi:hypothetical protein